MYPSMVSLATFRIFISGPDESTGLLLFSLADDTDQGEASNREDGLLTLSNLGTIPNQSVRN